MFFVGQLAENNRLLRLSEKDWWWKKFLITPNPESCRSLLFLSLGFIPTLPSTPISQPSLPAFSCSMEMEGSQVKEGSENIRRSWQRQVMVKGSKKWNLTKGQYVALEGFQCPWVMCAAEEKTKRAAQTQRSLSSPPPCPWGSGPTSLLFPSQAECFPKDPENWERMCVTPGASETKAKQEKKLPLMCPSPKGIHSEKQRESSLKMAFLGLWEGTSQWILRNNDKRVLGLW